MFYKKDVPKNSPKFRRKHLCWGLFLIKLQSFSFGWKRNFGTCVSFEFWDISKTMFLTKHHWGTAFGTLTPKLHNLTSKNIRKSWFSSSGSYKIRDTKSEIFNEIFDEIFQKYGTGSYLESCQIPILDTKILKYHLISWCGNFVERHSLRRVLGESPETMRKLCPATKFPHQEIKRELLFEKYQRLKAVDHFCKKTPS